MGSAAFYDCDTNWREKYVSWLRREITDVYMHYARMSYHDRDYRTNELRVTSGLPFSIRVGVHGFGSQWTTNVCAERTRIVDIIDKAFGIEAINSYHVFRW